MIHLTAASEIRLATQPADFRKGVDGFVALCEQQLQHNPRLCVEYEYVAASRKHTPKRLTA